MKPYTAQRILHKLARLFRKKEILIVDDDEDISYLVREALEKEGYRVREAGNALWALDEIQRRKPDLLVLDIMMPGMSGLELCGQIRKTAAINYLPVVMLTAKRLMGDIEDSIMIGADGYITKPFSVKELLDKVRQFT